MINKFNIQENVGNTLQEIFRTQIENDVGNITTEIQEKLFDGSCEHKLFGSRPKEYLNILIQELVLLSISVDHIDEQVKLYLSWDINGVIDDHRVEYDKDEKPVNFGSFNYSEVE